MLTLVAASTDPLAAVSEVVSIVAGWIVLRSAFGGFWILMRGGRVEDARKVAADLAFASFPSAVLIGIVCVLYLVLKG